MKISFAQTFLPWLGCLGLAVLSAGTARAQLVQQNISFEGGTRDWLEHVPASYDGTKAVPLVIALHGAYNDAAGYAPHSGWIDISDANGFIAIFPDGEGTKPNLVWNSWVFNGTKPDDIDFLTKVIAKVEATYNIDPTRVYMTGFSNGGGMTSFFAAAHADMLTAISPMSAGWVTITGTPETVLTPDAPLPAWVWRGDQDSSPAGATPLPTQDQQQTAFWATLAHDNTTAQVSTLGKEITSVYLGPAEVRYTSVTGWGHDVVPDSAARVWKEFFSRFSRVGGVIHTRGAPTIKVKATRPKAFARAGTKGTFLVSSDQPVTSDLAVAYQLRGSAGNGVDYQTLPGTVTLPAGTDSARVHVHPIADGDATGHKTVRFDLLPSADYTLDSEATAKVKIVEGR